MLAAALRRGSDWFGRRGISQLCGTKHRLPRV